MKIKSVFRKYNLTIRSGASLKNALKELIQELEDVREKERFEDFRAGVRAAIAYCPKSFNWEVEEEEIDYLTIENGYV